MSRACVYRAFDYNDRLLYVGRAVDLMGRLKYHRKHSPWWYFHSYLTVERFDTFAEAERAEVEAIRSEHPRWNVSGRSPDHPDGMIHRANGIRRAPWLREEIRAWELSYADNLPAAAGLS